MSEFPLCLNKSKEVIENLYRHELSRGKAFNAGVVKLAMSKAVWCRSIDEFSNVVFDVFDNMRSDGIRGPWLGAKRIEINGR